MQEFRTDQNNEAAVVLHFSCERNPTFDVTAAVQLLKQTTRENFNYKLLAGHGHSPHAVLSTLS